MRVSRVLIKNFKRFAPTDAFELHVRNTLLDEVARQFLLLGENGSGKTTVLQAVALVLSLAAGRSRRVEDFRWTGWVPERFLQHGTPFVEIDVSFEQDELLATKEVARRWHDAQGQGGRPDLPSRPFVEPGDAPSVMLRLEGTRLSAFRRQGSLLVEDDAVRFQFRGRSYAAMLARSDPAVRALFPRLPGVFWFDQFRNASIAGYASGNHANDAQLTGAAQLAVPLGEWAFERERKGPHPVKDFLGELERLFQHVFSGRSFAPLESVFGDGPAPVGHRFVLSDGRRTYAIEEMSAGEQSVLPLLFEFVRSQIHRSVVLLDEIDLNLHPPLAQRLLGLLPRLGQDNQFLFTSHSEAVVSLVSPAALHRLPGDGLCL